MRRNRLAPRSRTVLPLAFLASFFMSSLFVTAQAEQAASDAPLVILTVSKSPTTTQRALEGVIEAVNSTTVSAQTSGKVIELRFDVDDAVEKDEIIVKISDSEQSASFIQAEAAIANARSQLVQARNNFSRINQLYQNQTVSKAQFDQAQTALSSAQAGLKNAQAAMQQAEKQVEYTVVRAPYSGIVSERHVQLGATVAPGQPLMTGFSTEALRVSLDVPEKLARQLKTDSVASIQFGEQQFVSESLTIFPFSNPQTKTTTVRANLAPGIKGLTPGMSVKVNFALDNVEKIAIPESAIFIRSEVVGVYVVDADGHISLRHIRTGNRTADGKLIVVAGLNAGEKIAENPLAAIQQMKARQAAANSKDAQ